MASCFVLGSMVLVSLAEAMAGPSGRYCGTALGYNMNLNFTDSSHFDVSMMADGQPYMCQQEIYTFNALTGSIMTNVRNTSDCLAGGVKKHFDDADTVFFAYNAKANSITLTIDTVSTELAPTMCGLTAAATGPSGKYCGTALGYNMNLNFTDASHFDVRMTVEGQPYVCKQEAYTFDAPTGSITTDVRNSSDCLAGGVRKHYDDPETVFFVYDSKTNSITMTVDTVHTELAPSMCGLTVTRTGPSGKYCGTAQGYDMRLNFTDAHHFDVSMVADGQPYMCNEEPYTFDVSTGSIRTDVRNTSDCLAGGVRKHFDDPESVFFSYDSKSDTILLTIDTVNSELLPAACGLMALASVILV